MPADPILVTLGADGLRRFQALQAEAVGAVTERFYTTLGSAYEQFGPRGRDACREDLTFHLEFLRPVLEFGLLQPMVDYLCWLSSVLKARAIPAEHVTMSLEWLAAFFTERMDGTEGAAVTAALLAARTGFLELGEAPQLVPNRPELWPETEAFETALLDGDHQRALTIINQCIDDGHTFVEVELHVIQSALYDIGEKWQRSQVTVAQEHMATAIVQSVLTAGLLRSPPLVSIGKRVLLACVEGNNHSVGLRMVTDAFLLAGWDVQYLGASVPTSALVLQVAEWKPDLVGLSVSFAHQLRVVKEVIAKMSEQLGGAKPAVIIGGLAINRFNQLADMVDADACGIDAQAAVKIANQLVNT